MTGQALRLRTPEVLRALDGIDLLELVAGELTHRALANGSRLPAGPPHTAEETEALDPETGIRVLLPTAALRMVRTAGLATLAARELHIPGVVTAAVFGSGTALACQIALLARHLPMLSHTAVCPLDSPRPAFIDRAVLDQLEMAGVGLSTATTPKEAAFGASLLIVAGGDAERIDPHPLYPGVLTINGSGRDLPDGFVDDVHRIVVDDLSLLPANRHRGFVGQHLDGQGPPPEPPRDLEGWHRVGSAWREHRRIEADLGSILTGARPGRAHDEEILLVELLGAALPDATLAGRIGRAAVARGLGRRVG